MKHILLPTLLIMLLVTTACSLTPVAPAAGQAFASAETDTEVAPQSGPGMGQGNGMGMGRGMRMGGMMGMGNDMMARHMAPIPQEYADEASLVRGKETYTLLCASCHGDGGMGDGPAGAALDPVPAPIAHTSQMMGDDYLF